MYIKCAISERKREGQQNGKDGWEMLDMHEMREKKLKDFNRP